MTDVIQVYRKSPTEKNAQKVLDAYTPFLYKWHRFLRTAFDKYESQFLTFLGLFKLPGDPHSKHEFILRSLRAYESDEIKQEVHLAFLEACNRAEYPSLGFIYILAKHIRQLIQDPLVFGSHCRSGYEEEREDSFSEDSEVISFHNQEVVLDQDWIKGMTVDHPLLQKLSPLDRELLVRKYLAEQSSAEIAQDMGYTSQNSVRNALSRAVSRVRHQDENHVQETKESRSDPPGHSSSV